MIGFYPVTKRHIKMNSTPRYVIKSLHADGLEHYRFNPPQKYIDEGVVYRKQLGTDKDKAFNKANAMLIELDAHVEKMSRTVSLNPTVKGLYDEYLLSNDFNMLREKTQKDYIYFLNIMLSTNYIGRKDYRKVTTKLCKLSYEEWVKRGVSFANHILSVSSRLYRYAIEMGYTELNPFKNVTKKTQRSKRLIWTNEEVKTFLDKAYSDYKFRSIGLIVHMAYEFGQRIGDMRLLTWDNIKFDIKQLHLEQSKKRKEVFLPIEDNLFSMLQKQHTDFGFQKYVAPNTRPKNNKFVPYSIHNVSVVGKEVMRKADIRSELQLMHLRATAITEMDKSGVGINQIMSVSGHSNPQSVQPYLKHNFKSANYALTKRKNCDT